MRQIYKLFSANLRRLDVFFLRIFHSLFFRSTNKSNHIPRLPEYDEVEAEEVDDVENEGNGENEDKLEMLHYFYATMTNVEIFILNLYRVKIY